MPGSLLAMEDANIDNHPAGICIPASACPTSLREEGEGARREDLPLLSSPTPFFLSAGTISLRFTLATAGASLFSAHVLPSQLPSLSLQEESLLQLALVFFSQLLPPVMC